MKISAESRPGKPLLEAWKISPRSVKVLTTPHFVARFFLSLLLSFSPLSPPPRSPLRSKTIPGFMEHNVQLMHRCVRNAESGVDIFFSLFLSFSFFFFPW